MIKNPARISFTAHYTGYVWFKNGLSHPVFVTSRGKKLYKIISSMESVVRPLLGMDLETSLLQRHHIINHQLHHLISTHEVPQILEIAAGLSPRGLLFKKIYPKTFKYVEADLPKMTAHKEKLLKACNSISDTHYCVTLDVLDKNAAHSLHNVIQKNFDCTKPIIIITEGLINYFHEPLVRDLWQRLNESMKLFPKAFYISDIYLNELNHPLLNLGKYCLKMITRSGFNYLFDNEKALSDQLKFAGFSAVSIINPNQPVEGLENLPKSNNPNPLRVLIATK